MATHRGCQLFWIAPLLSFWIANVAHAQPLQPLQSTPAEEVFGEVQYGLSQKSALTLKNINPTEARIGSISLHGPDAGLFQVSGGPTLPYTINAGHTANYSITFSPLKLGQFSASLDIQYNENGINKVASVNLVGNGACISSTAACDPVAPLCRVSADFPHELFTVEGYTNMVTPYIAEHYAIHRFQPDKSYDMPVSTFWNVLGLSDIFKDPTAGQSCSCGYTIHFQRDVTMVRRALFTRDGPAITLTSPPITGLPDTSIELSLPNRMSGVAYVFPGTSEFHFGSGLPHLKVVWMGDLIFDDDIDCLNSSTAYASVRRVHPTDQRPGLNLLFEGQ